MKIRVKVVKRSGSRAIVIPAYPAKVEGIEVDDIVNVEITKVQKEEVK